MELEDRVSSSELIVIGHSGLMTSTGGSINAEIEIETVLKGSAGSRRIPLAFSTFGRMPAAEFERGERCLFFLQVLKTAVPPAYGLVGDDLRAIIPFNQRVVQEIQTLLAAG
jgi:hypothetical protein